MIKGPSRGPSLSPLALTSDVGQLQSLYAEASEMLNPELALRNV